MNLFPIELAIQIWIMKQGTATGTFSHLPSVINIALTERNPQSQQRRELKKIQLQFLSFWTK